MKSLLARTLISVILAVPLLGLAACGSTHGPPAAPIMHDTTNNVNGGDPTGDDGPDRGGGDASDPTGDDGPDRGGGDASDPTGDDGPDRGGDD